MVETNLTEKTATGKLTPDFLKFNQFNNDYKKIMTCTNQAPVNKYQISPY